MNKFLYSLSIAAALHAFLISCSKKENLNSLNFENSPAGNNSELPYLTTGKDGFLYLSWVERVEQDATVLKYSRFVTNEWSIPEVIARGDDWFVNWADYPMISINSKGDMIAHYLQNSAAGTYTYDIQTVQKIGKGSWKSPIKLHSDNTESEHGFVSILPLDSGDFMLTWLDGRNTVSEPQENHSTHTQHGSGAMTIRSAMMNSKGQVINESELDRRVCDCCQTGSTMTLNGPVVVYRDRSHQEIRDISIVRHVKNKWTSPKTVFADNWEIEGCPVNGPKIASVNNNLIIAWFTASQDKPSIKVIFSPDGGATFEKPIIVDNTDPLGRVDVVMLNEQVALVSWLDQHGETALIKAAKFNHQGMIGEAITITKTSASRSSGFPQMERIDDKIYFAWTDIEDQKVKVASIILEEYQD